MLHSAGWVRALLSEALQPKELPAELDERAAALMARYLDLLLAWNRRINLTGARSAEALVREHLADALPLLPHLPGSAFDFVDVGSGAGLPGIAIAVLRPDARGVLLEPVSKKQAFLAAAIRELGLPGVRSLRERLDQHRAGGTRYQVAVSRATWPAAEWLERGRTIVRPGGLVLGLEGASRPPLPPGATRHPYRCAGRERAVVVLRMAPALSGGAPDVGSA